AKEDETTRNDIYAISEKSTQPLIVTDTDGFKNNPTIDPSGKALLFIVPNQSPFPQRNANAGGGPGGGGGGGQRGGGGGGGGGGPRQPTKFGIADLSTHKVNIVNGTAPTISSDGAWVAYLNATQAENSLMTLPMAGGNS